MLHQCHFIRAKFLSGSKISKDQINRYIKNAFSNTTDWVENGIKAFDMCIDHVAMYADDIRSVFSAEKFNVATCNPIFMSVETCSFMYLFRNCPKKDWNESEYYSLANRKIILNECILDSKCEAWKKHIEDCHSEEKLIIKLNNITPEELKEESLLE